MTELEKKNGHSHVSLKVTFGDEEQKFCMTNCISITSFRGKGLRCIWKREQFSLMETQHNNAAILLQLTQRASAAVWHDGSQVTGPDPSRLNLPKHIPITHTAAWLWLGSQGMSLIPMHVVFKSLAKFLTLSPPHSLHLTQRGNEKGGKYGRWK